MPPELYLVIYRLFQGNEIIKARKTQDECCHLIYRLCSGKSNMYAAIKETLRLRGAPDIDDLREPLFNLITEDETICKEYAEKTNTLIAKLS